jgi:pyruvate kinase
VSTNMPNGFAETAQRALNALVALSGDLRAAECALLPVLATLPAESQLSAKNLIHYVTMRRADLRELQAELSQLGLSSLGRAEGDVLGGIHAICLMLHKALGTPHLPAPRGHRRARSSPLDERSRALFGTGPTPALMVTMPGSAAHDPALITELLAQGMQVMRINAAHEDVAAIRAIVGHLRAAETASGLRCKVLVDLAGPKLRTLGIMPGPRVLKLKPRKDERGQVEAPASVVLRGPGRRREGQVLAEGEVQVPKAFLEQLRAGDSLVVEDTRGKRRELIVERCEADRVLCQVPRTTYLAPGMELGLRRKGKSRIATNILEVPAKVGAVVVRVDDELELRGDTELGHPAMFGRRGELLARASVSCGLPALIAALKPGHHVLFDDGKIVANVMSVEDDVARLRIIRVRGEIAKLRAEKGINVPDTHLALPSLDEDDLEVLRTAVELADMVALSFVRSVEDVRTLHRELARLGARDIGVLLKIETRRGFEELPSILVEGLRRPNVGVMIARGDLAVEVGFERMAELQEEMLWLCEAAHVPVVWATQVLETLAKEGMPTRAEITDAAMAERAECVMLNKGPFVVEALRSLRDIVDRMHGHQEKKRAMLRPLRSLSPVSEGSREALPLTP